MVGELDLAIADQKAKVEFLGEEIILCLADYKTARRIISQPMPSLGLIGKLLAFSEMGLKARVGRRRPIELFPQPGWIVRMLSPAVRDMLYSSKTSVR